MTIEKFLDKYGFEPCLYYIVVDNVVCRNVAAGPIKEDMFKRAFRRVGNYKIYAVHFNNYEPYTTYYIVVNNVVYHVDYHITIINEMVADLKAIKGE